MSLRADAGFECAYRTANLPTTNSFSACCWIKLDTGSGNNRITLYCQDGVSGDRLYWGLELSGAGDNRKLGTYCDDNNSGGTNAGLGEGALTVPNGQWVFVTMVGTNVATTTKISAYVGGTLYDAGSLSGAAFPPVAIAITKMVAFGVDNITGVTLRGLGAHMRVWDAILTEAEFLTESASTTPVRTTNFNTGFSGASTTLTDTGPNGRDWTNNGLTYDSDEPLGPAVTYYRTRFVT